MINPSTQFIVYNPDVNLTERKSALNNNIQQVLTYEEIINSAGITSSSISANGFMVTGAINSDILLPENSNVSYNGPLSIGTGRVIVPTGTILSII